MNRDESGAQIQTILNLLSARLSVISESAALDAQVLLGHILGKPRAWVLAHPEVALEAGQQAALQEAVRRLEAGEPLPYVLGHWGFYKLDLLVTPAVLIPRPETELLVDTALAWLRAHPGRRRAVDIGTGSGAIALALASETPDVNMLACDLSSAALQVAQANAQRCGVTRQVRFVQCDLLPPLGEPIDLICANLPYIPTSTLTGLAVARREPRLALDGGVDGLDAIRRLLSLAPAHLAPGGLLLVEIEASQGAAVTGLAQAAFPQAEVRLQQDLAGRDRLVSVCVI